LVLQRRPLLLDLLKALLLGAELSPNRRQLFAYGMEAPFVVFELPLGALQFRLPLREFRASLRGAGLGGGKRFLDILAWSARRRSCASLSPSNLRSVSEARAPKLVMTGPELAEGPSSPGS
jgi:hypothetical protein